MPNIYQHCAICLKLPQAFLFCSTCNARIFCDVNQILNISGLTFFNRIKVDETLNVIAFFVIQELEIFTSNLKQLKQRRKQETQQTQIQLAVSGYRRNLLLRLGWHFFPFSLYISIHPTEQNSLQFSSFENRRLTFLNYVQFVDRRIYGLRNCEMMFGQASCSSYDSFLANEPHASKSKIMKQKFEPGCWQNPELDGRLFFAALFQRL